jgi:HSP20 family protein
LAFLGDDHRWTEGFTSLSGVLVRSWALVTDFSHLPAESRELEDDLRVIFAGLAAQQGRDRRAYSGEYTPPLDVVDTGDTVEVLVDVAGVSPQAIAVLFRRNVLIVAGEKAPAPRTVNPTFHLIEREFGRFVRAVRLSGAFDVPHARATVEAGELRVVVPRRADRRDQPHTIPISLAPSTPA